MLNVRRPLFQVEDTGDWGALAQSLFSSDEVQPEVDTEDASLDAEETETVEDEAQADETEGDESSDDSEQPAFSDETEIELGEGRQPVKLAELKAGYLRQSDYTKKTQMLSEERKTFEAEREQWAPVKSMSDFLQANPYLSEQIQYFIREFTNTGNIPLEEALQDAQYGQYINTLLSENHKLSARLQEVEGKYGELEFTGTMKDLKSELKAEYGDLATEEYLNTLQERAKAEKLPLNVLKEIADAHLTKKKLEQTTQQSKKVAAKTIQHLQETKSSLPPQPSSKGPVPKVSVDTSGMSYAELARMRMGV